MSRTTAFLPMAYEAMASVPLRSELEEIDDEDNTEPELMELDDEDDIEPELMELDDEDDIEPELMEHDDEDNIEPELEELDDEDSTEPELEEPDDEDDTDSELEELDDEDDTDSELEELDDEDDTDSELEELDDEDDTDSELEELDDENNAEPELEELDDEDDSEPEPSFSFDLATIQVENSFRNSGKNGNSRFMAPSMQDVAIALNSRRRTGITGSRGFASAYLDQDNSGNYDPSSKPRVARRQRITRTPRARAENSFVEDGNTRQRTDRRSIGYSLMLTITFVEPANLQRLRLMLPGPWPPSSGNEGGENDSGDGNSFKPRRKVKKLRRFGDVVEREDGLTLESLTIGHPQRRGCKHCFAMGDDECTLIDQPLEYPCLACEDAGVGCQLIIPPELKNICESCKESRRPCSYRKNGGQGVGTCDECKKDGIACCAAPLEEFERPGISTSLPPLKAIKTTSSAVPLTPVVAHVLERRYVACNQCHDGLICTSKGKESMDPCKGCKKKVEQCKFALPPTRSHPLMEESDASDVVTPPPTDLDMHGNEHTPTTHTAALYSELKTKFERRQRLRESRRDRNNVLEVPGYSSSAGYTAGNKHIFIDTYFCHPITFNFVPDAKGCRPCSWCQCPLFGLHGLMGDSHESRRVEGFYWPDGSGFEEVSGGYSEEGYPPSDMCIGCTTQRLMIRGCDGHQTIHMKSWAEYQDRYGSDDWLKAANALGNGDKDGASLILSTKWCSICPSIATFKCCTETGFSGDNEDSGCGLQLCNGCEELMQKCEKVLGLGASGSLVVDVLIGEKRKKQLLHPQGLRADAYLLESEGELEVRMQLAMDMGSTPKTPEAIPVAIATNRQFARRETRSFEEVGDENQRRKRSKGKGKSVDHRESSAIGGSRHFTVRGGEGSAQEWERARARPSVNLVDTNNQGEREIRVNVKEVKVKTKEDDDWGGAVEVGNKRKRVPIFIDLSEDD